VERALRLGATIEQVCAASGLDPWFVDQVAALVDLRAQIMAAPVLDEAVLRRAKSLPKDQENYSFGEVEVNLKSCQVSRSGKALDFSSKEFELLKYFLCHPGEALSRDRLLEDVWGYDRFPTTRTVDAHIVRLRQKVEPKPEEPRFILTVHGTGYKFVG